MRSFTLDPPSQRLSTLPPDTASVPPRMRDRKVAHVIFSSLLSPLGGGRTRILDETRVLRDKGFSVSIACFVPMHLFLARRRAIRRTSDELSLESGASVFRLARLPMTRLGGVRWLSECLGTLGLLLLLKKKRIQLIHCHQLGAFAMVRRIQRFIPECKVVLDVHGCGVQEYLYSEKDCANPRFLDYLSWKERSALESADWLVFVSEAMRSHFEREYRRSFANSTIIPCAVKPAPVADSAQREALRKQHGLQGRFVFCYLGSLQPYQLPEEMCLLFRNAMTYEPDAFFFAITHASAELSRIARSVGIPPDRFRVVSARHSDTNLLVQLADVGLLLRDDSLVNRVSSPTKFGEYCMAGVPTITTSHVGDISTIVEKHGVGVVIPLPAQDQTRVLAPFTHDVKAQRSLYQERCRDFAMKSWSWDVFGTCLLEVYAKVSPAP